MDGASYIIFLGGAAGGSALSAPLLAMDQNWVTTQNTPKFMIETSGGVVAGYKLEFQVQPTGGNWSSLTYDIVHTLTSADMTADGVNFGFGLVPNGTYDARLRVISPSNAVGAWSNAVTFTINLLAAPANTILPSFTGNTVTTGNVLTGNVGTWTGTAPITYAYQWQKNGVAIGGATSSTYTTQTGDLGATITLVVSATNSQGGPISATSAGVRIGPPMSWAYVGGFSTTGSSTGISTTMDFGASDTTKYVALAMDVQNSPGPITAVTVGGVSLTRLVAYQGTGTQCEMWGGLVGASATGVTAISVTYTSSAAFLGKNLRAWKILNPVNSGPVASGATAAVASVNVSVNANDLLIAACPTVGGPLTFAGSTQTPTDAYTDLLAGSPSLGAADWTIATTNAAFQIKPSSSNQIYWANFR